MTHAWSAEDLDRIAAAEELEIATIRADGTMRRWLPIWVVRVDEHVYVRTWHRRDTGWFGHAVADARARIRVPGVETDVVVEDVGADDAQLRAEIDTAYRTKYVRFGPAGERMAEDDAAAATLRLVHATA